MPFDEKGSFVGKKERPCDPDEPADARQGDNGDHVAFDPEHRLVVSVVPGKRTEEKVHQLVQDFKARTAGRINCRSSPSFASRPTCTRACQRQYSRKPAR